MKRKRANNRMSKSTKKKDDCAMDKIYSREDSEGDEVNDRNNNDG